jgi:predicted acylesterase/phospholipase RssA
MPRRPTHCLIALAAALAGGAMGCSALRTKGALQALNGTSSPPDPKYQVTLSTRVARLAKGHLADAYVDPARAAGWMAALGHAPAPLERLAGCIVSAATALGPEEACYDAFMRDTAGVIPPPARWDALAARASAEVGLELDAERFLANARALGASLAALERMVGRGPLPPDALRAGLAEGADRAAAYVRARSWRRNLARPSTAVVLSGGGANGAFSAGLLWRLLDVLQTCRAAASGGCPGAGIDLAAGTSTGALISLLVDLAATRGQEAAARDLLVDAYTCSTNARLYCVKDEWIWKLATGDVKGLARFDGIRALIQEKVTPAVGQNATERVVVSVDFQSGDVYGQSDQDPEDAGDWDHQVNAVLASIVEPVLAEPIGELSRDGKPLPGTFLDGGVRSGLPLLEAVRRGAERVLVVNTSGLEPSRTGPQRNAFQILTRTIDLLSGQSRPGELQQGELAALERRWIEYSVCQERLSAVPGVDRDSLASFCERRNLRPAGGGHVELAAPSFTGPPYFRQVSSSWRTSWVFRPEEDLASAEGYAFDPKVMRPLFELGVRTFQRRCREVLNLLAIDGPVAGAACDLSEDDAVARARLAFKPEAACSAGVGEIRSCP